MMRIMALALLAIVAAAAIGIASAQATPNFSGTWTLDASRSYGPGNSAETSGPVVLVITQNTKTLTLRWGKQPPMVVNLDGSNSVYHVKGRSGTQAVTLRARWQGAQLHIMTDSLSQTMSLSADASELTINTVGLRPGGRKHSKEVFKKSKPPER